MAELEHPKSVKMPNQTADERKDRGAGENAPRDYGRSNEHKPTINLKEANRITKAK
ncbi:MAG TPA: hypothetical protein VGI78_10700 [Acetobacteraceae bacterium]|jgi:hypothetical protein